MMPPDQPEPDMKAVHTLVTTIKDSPHEHEVVAAASNLGNVITGIAAIDTLARLLLPHIRIALGSPEGGAIEVGGMMVQHPTTGQINELADHTRAAEARVLRLLTLLSGGNIDAALDIVDEAVEEGMAFGDMLMFLASLYRSAYSGSLQARHMGMS